MYFKEHSKFNKHHLSREAFESRLTDFLGFYPTIRKEKLIDFIDVLRDKPKRMIVQGVTGAGNTTLIRTIAYIIAGDENRIMEAYCVQKFELKLNSQYIGNVESNHFEKGMFLNFMDSAINNPQSNYVFVIHDIGKIYPETFFGPEMWRELEDIDQNYSNYIRGIEISIPDNLYIISNKLEGASSSNLLNAQHFVRLGNLKEHEYDPWAFSEYLKGKVEKNEISDSYRMQVVYFFIKCNELVTKRYATDYTIGQWGDLRKLYREDDIEDFIQIFISHVNSFKPTVPLKREDFNEILYAMKNKGLLNRSSKIDMLYTNAIELGFFTEFLVGLVFVAFSYAIGRYLINKRKRHVHQMIKSVDEIFNGKKLRLEVALQKKIELKEMVIDGKINHTEALFLRNYIEDRIQMINLEN